MKNPPEYKRFRTGVAAAYVAVAVVSSVCAAVSAGIGAYERMGRPPASVVREKVDAVALAGCMKDLDQLSTELNNRLDATLASWPARRSSVEWEDWSPAWHQRFLDVGAHCRLAEGDVPAAAALREAWSRLGALHRHYTTLAVQFSKEIGPNADALHDAMERARKSMPVP
ncbi:MAG: hypothetical protein QM765_05360 [Myxococcales bacterium]